MGFLSGAGGFLSGAKTSKEYSNGLNPFQQFFPQCFAEGNGFAGNDDVTLGDFIDLGKVDDVRAVGTDEMFAGKFFFHDF